MVFCVYTVQFHSVTCFILHSNCGLTPIALATSDLNIAYCHFSSSMYMACVKLFGPSSELTGHLVFSLGI